MHTKLPHQTAAVPQMQISLVGVKLKCLSRVIPKCNRPNKWRLIVDLSAPLGASINDCVDQKFSSIAYTSIDDAVSAGDSLEGSILR